MTRKRSSASQLASLALHSKFIPLYGDFRLDDVSLFTPGLSARTPSTSHTRTSTAHLASTFPGIFQRQNHFLHTS